MLSVLEDDLSIWAKALEKFWGQGEDKERVSKSLSRVLDRVMPPIAPEELGVLVREARRLVGEGGSHEADVHHAIARCNKAFAFATANNDIDAYSQAQRLLVVLHSIAAKRHDRRGAAHARYLLARVAWSLSGIDEERQEECLARAVRSFYGCIHLLTEEDHEFFMCLESQAKWFAGISGVALGELRQNERTLERARGRCAWSALDRRLSIAQRAHAREAEGFAYKIWVLRHLDSGSDDQERRAQLAFCIGMSAQSFTDAGMLYQAAGFGPSASTVGEQADRCLELAEAVWSILIQKKLDEEFAVNQVVVQQRREEAKRHRNASFHNAVWRTQQRWLRGERGKDGGGIPLELEGVEEQGASQFESLDTEQWVRAAELDSKIGIPVSSSVSATNEQGTRIGNPSDAVPTDVDAGAAFAAAIAAARDRMVSQATDAEIAEVSALLSTAKAGLEKAHREDFVVALREMLDSKLLDIFDAGSGKKLTLTLKGGQAYLQGGGTTRTLGEVEFRVDRREAPTFSSRRSRAKTKSLDIK